MDELGDRCLADHGVRPRHRVRGPPVLVPLDLAADHADDRAEVNRVLAMALGDSPLDSRGDGDDGVQPVVGGRARVGSAPSMPPGGPQSPAAIVAAGRRAITDPTDAPPF